MTDKARKNILQNSVLKMIAALAIVGIVSGMTLVFVYNYAMPKIIVNVNNETEQAIKSILAGASRIEDTRIEGVFKVSDGSGKFLGYAFLAEGNGYQGTIKLLAGVDPTISLMKGMEVIESQETPGLGAEIAEENFKKQFIDLPITAPMQCVKNKKKVTGKMDAVTGATVSIEAITGATISSRAVVKMLDKRIEEIHDILKGRK